MNDYEKEIQEAIEKGWALEKKLGRDGICCICSDNAPTHSFFAGTIREQFKELRRLIIGKKEE